MSLAVSEIQLEGRMIYSGMVRDISKRKAAERELEQVAQSLMQSNEELERFAYVASHDLKAPLRAIDNLSKWLQEDLHDSLDGESKENMTTLRKRVHRMENLLDDLLEYSRIGRKNDDEKTEIVDTQSLIGEVIALINPPKEFVFEFDDALQFIRLPNMPLHQVFQNLITNAIKHHHRGGGTIKVTAEELDGVYRFAVKDDGPGIPEPLQEKIFEMFQTIKPRDEVEGSGMGLTLVQKIVAQQGGTVWVISPEGKGASFYFTWPKFAGIQTKKEVV